MLLLRRVFPILPYLLLVLNSDGFAEDHTGRSYVRVASITFEPAKFDLIDNAKTLEYWFRAAAAGGAKIAVAPEGVLEGHVVNDIISQNADEQQMLDVAVTIDSPMIQRFQSLAKTLDMCLVFGFAERINQDIFNCGIFIDQNGRIRGKHHKMQFTEGYDESWWFNRLGTRCRTFDTPFGQCGMLLSNALWNPQLARITALDGAQFLVIPAFGSTATEQDQAVLERNAETGLPIIEANVGVSLIVDDGKIVAIDRHREGVTFGKIKIPRKQATDKVERDRIETEFLEWREQEMPRRLVEYTAMLGKTTRVVWAGENGSSDRDKVKPANRDDDVAWYDAKDIGVEGKAWEDTEAFFDRLPARAKSTVRPPVWSLSQDTAGMCVRFVTDARTIHAKWTLRSETLAMPHMPATGVSGLDLYVRHHGQWRWLAVGRPTQQSNTARLIHQVPKGKREYLLYLPLYNGVTSLELGLPVDATLWRKRFDRARKPLVFWGTSITQGGCASRPGMVHTATLGRRFARPVINLGFSGNGKMEPEVAELISEIDAAVYIIDCLPNLTGALVSQRVRPLVDILRKTRPDTPILLVEDRTFSNAFLIDTLRHRNDTNRLALRTEYNKMQTDGISNLYYLKGDGLLGMDSEDTVDGSHPTDLGFLRQAAAFEDALRPILGSPHARQRWLKGNLHTHSLWSDGNDFPEMIADWYRQHGYQFLALSDHNVLSHGTKWMKLSDIEKRNGKQALTKYIARFGRDWVETRGSEEDGSFEVRLKPLEEVRALVETSGEFLMIPSEEITDQGAHINATNIGELIEPQGGASVRETIQNNLRAVDAQAKRLGRTIIPHLNHPNLGNRGISAEELAALIQDEFFEVFNGVENDGDLGSPRRHSLETLWDVTSTLRISQFHAPPMFGLATDDSHHYHGGRNASPGRGWIMLRATKLTPESIVKAMQLGNFYASSGVRLRTLEFNQKENILHLSIEPDGDATFTTQFIGTPANFDRKTSVRVDSKTGKPVEGVLDYSEDVGKVLATTTGLEASYQLTGDELYVRATVTSSRAPENPTSESPFKKAWTQPVGWQSHLP